MRASGCGSGCRERAPGVSCLRARRRPLAVAPADAVRASAREPSWPAFRCQCCAVTCAVGDAGYTDPQRPATMTRCSRFFWWVCLAPLALAACGDDGSGTDGPSDGVTPMDMGQGEPVGARHLPAIGVQLYTVRAAMQQ